jgi:hypothetical protein
MRNGADWKDPADNIFYQRGLTAVHQMMNVAAEIPNRQITPPTKPMLFNIEKDPEEKRDLSAEHPERISSMITAWDEWFKSVTKEWETTYQDNVRIND